MRICLVTTAFPRWIGDGDGAFVGEFAWSLARHGIDVCVIATHSPRLPTRERIENVEIFRPRYWWPEHWELLRREVGGLPVVWRKYPLARFQVLSLVLVYTVSIIRYSQVYNVIHAHWTLSAGAACLGRWIHQRPVLVTVQGSDILQVPQSWVGARITRIILSNCDAITALTHALKERIIKIGVDPAKVCVIPNGVNTTKFVPISDLHRENLILFVGSLIKRKGVRYLLEAMQRVIRNFPEYRLVIVGDGPEKKDLIQHASNLGLSAHVDFVGFQAQDRVRSFMQRARLLVLPSLEEGMGVVLVEAMACGTPVVASWVDGIRDVVTSDVGILVPPADSERLAEGICEILADPVRWKRYSRNARDRAVTYYEWDVIVEKFINLYKSLDKTK